MGPSQAISRCLPKSQSAQYLSILVILYLAAFGSLLFTTSGMPYVMDGNETYSSIVHADSIAHFGISKSKGLADEALGPSAAAHPFVHSHQGNYPRLFAWVIYELGATTPAQQVWVTTLTIGLGALLFAFAFFSKIANPWFALLCCLVFLTDYVFFAQWQVVTYRVWYAFVFFLQFLVIERWVESKQRHWLLLLIANTALFSYGELIFTAFLGLASVIWLVFRGRKSVSTLVWGLIGLAAGLVIALLILSVQGIGYLGTDNFLKDVQLTFGARNNFDGKGTSLADIASFYRDHKVIFWENLQSRDEFIGLLPFVRSIVSGFVQTNSPISFVFFGCCFAYFVISTQMSAAFGIKIFGGDHLTKRELGLVAAGTRYIAVSCAIVCLLALAQSTVGFYYSLSVIPSVSFPLAATEVVLLAWLMMPVDRRANHLFYGLVLILCLMLFSLPFVIGSGYSAFWLDAHGRYIAVAVPWLLPLLVVALARTHSIQRLPLNVVRKLPDDSSRLSLAVLFMLTGLGSYAIVYHLSPGYVFSGYSVRFAPFLVYFADVGIAIALFVPLSIAYFMTRQCFVRERTLSNVGLAVLANMLLIFILWLWLGLQYSHLRRLPPNHFDVFQRLTTSPFKGASFIVNTYAAPIGVQTGQWAYMDPNIGRAMFVEVRGENRLIGDRRYLWLADKDSNVNYRRPDYFICLLGQNIDTALNHVVKRAAPSCLDFPLVKLAVDKQRPLPGLSLVQYDETGPERVGFVSWAIVKFDWDNGLGGGLVWDGDPGVSVSTLKVVQ